MFCWSSPPLPHLSGQRPTSCSLRAHHVLCLSCVVSQKAGKLFGIFTAQDRFGRPVLLFRNEWKLANVQGELPELKLVPWSRPPDIE